MMLRVPGCRPLIALLASAVLLTGCGKAAEEKEAAVTASLRTALQGARRPPYVTADAEGKRLWKLTNEFYAAREFKPAWIEGAAPRAQMADLIKALWSADHEGLDPQLYNVSLLDQRRQEASRGFLTAKGFEP